MRENLFINDLEHRYLVKNKKDLESEYNITLYLPIVLLDKNSHNDTIYISIEGAAKAVRKLKNYIESLCIRKRMCANEIESNEIQVITLSDSDDEKEDVPPAQADILLEQAKVSLKKPPLKKRAEVPPKNPPPMQVEVSQKNTPLEHAEVSLKNKSTYKNKQKEQAKLPPKKAPLERAEVSPKKTTLDRAEVPPKKTLTEQVEVPPQKIPPERVAVPPKNTPQKQIQVLLGETPQFKGKKIKKKKYKRNVKYIAETLCISTSSEILEEEISIPSTSQGQNSHSCKRIANTFKLPAPKRVRMEDHLQSSPDVITLSDSDDENHVATARNSNQPMNSNRPMTSNWLMTSNWPTNSNRPMNGNWPTISFQPVNGNQPTISFQSVKGNPPTISFQPVNGNQPRNSNQLAIPFVPKPPTTLRPVVIDGSNVAREHGRATNVYSCMGIKISVQYFLMRGHTKVVAFVPKFRKFNKGGHVETTDQYLLEEMEKTGHVVFTPSRRIENRLMCCYDDRFIVKLASENGGVILSNDNYKDLQGESDAFKKTILERLLMFLFVGDTLMIPDDPLGRGGPTLQEFLSMPL